MAKSVRKTPKGDWKKNPVVGVVMAVLIVISWISFYRWAFDEGIELKDFPYQFITEEPGATPIEKRMSSTEKANMKIPFKEPGNDFYFWDAYTCTNPQCPYLARSGGQPIIYPLANDFDRMWADQGYPERNPDAMMMMGGMMPMCPACGQPTVEPFDTPEGKKKKEEYYAELKRKYG